MAKSAVLIASARMDHKADVLKELRNRQSGVGRRERALHSAIYVYIYIYICSFFFFFGLLPRTALAHIVLFSQAAPSAGEAGSLSFVLFAAHT